MLKPIKDFDKYLVSEDGKVYSLKSKRYLSINKNKNVEYYQVSLWKNNVGYHKYVHRLVAEAFIPNPDNLLEVNHIDGNRLNNHVSNLEWCSRTGNAQHAVDTGLRTYTNRLDRETFIKCLYEVINGKSYAELTKEVPYKVPFLSTKVKKLARELGLEEQLITSLKQQHVNRLKARAKNK